MIPIIGRDGWFFMPLRPTRYAPAKIAKLKVVGGEIVQAFARERHVLASRTLHWVAGIGDWTEPA